MQYLGDFRLGDTVEVWFGSRAVDGASITLATNGTPSIWSSGGVVVSGFSYTLEEDKGGFVGTHRLAVTLDPAIFSPFKDYVIGLTGTVVDGKIQNVPIAAWSIFNRGTEVVAKTTLAAVSVGGGTLTEYSKVNAGDYVRTIPNTGRGDLAVIQDFNAGTGAFTVRVPWRTLPTVGQNVMVIAAPSGGLITAADIQDGAFTTSKFPAGFLTGALIADNAITFNKIADTAIRASKIEDGTLTTAKFAAAALANSLFPDGVINARLLHADVQTELAGHDHLEDVLAALQGTLVTVLSRLPAALVSGRIDADIIGSLQAHNLDANTNTSVYDLLMVLLAFLGGTSNGWDADGGVVNFRDMGDTKNVISATVDEFGNRTSVTLDP